METFYYDNSDDEDNSQEIIDKLLKTLENDKYEDVMELTFKKIKTIKNDILQSLELTRNELVDFKNKLENYRYVDEVNEFKLGNYIRSIDLKNPDNIKLSRGGILIDIEAINSKLMIKLKNYRNSIFRLKFEEHLFFQKLNQQEETLLTVLNYLEKNS
tara:strand:+ start:3201 stop:3674 length:474 start_codon:yes stop_codon:yes gene_type:complete